ncbi:transglutaminaseTgpA domain-containing protein [Cryobacterium arcticum]
MSEQFRIRPRHSIETGARRLSAGHPDEMCLHREGPTKGVTVNPRGPTRALFRRMRFAARTDARWPLTFALLLLLLTGCGALGPLLHGTAWWWAMAVTAGVVLVAAGALRSLGIPRYLVPAMIGGVLLLTLTLLFGRGSGVLWLIPTGDTVKRFQTLFTSGVMSIQEQGTPADATAGIVFLLATGAGLIAILMDVLAITLRWPAAAGVPVLVPVVAPGFLLDEGADVAALVVASAAFFVLLRVAARIHENGATHLAGPDQDAARQPLRSGPVWVSVAIASIGIGGALTLSAVTPPLTDGGSAGGSLGALSYGSGINPMIDLGRDLRQPKPRPALHYVTTADQPPYLKILTLDRFIETNWTARPDPPRQENTLDDIRKPDGVSADVPTSEMVTSVVIDRLDTSWLPAPTAPTRVDGLSGNWRWGDTARTISSLGSSTRGQEYTVTSLQLKPTVQQLRNSSTDYPAEALNNLELPTPRPEVVDQTARVLATGTTSNYDAAVAIQEYLRSDDFRYDTEAPVEEGFDGGGVDVIGRFLEVKRGYCVQFASAMAVMARVLGIPARVALGYGPGTRVPGTGQEKARYEISSDDLHTWPELYFVDIGWLPFEPTPGRGAVPDYARPDAVSSGSTPLSGQPTRGPSSSQANPTDELGGLVGPESQLQDSGSLSLLGLISALVAVILITPGVVRLLVRERRRHRIRSGRGGASAAWAEITDTALDHGIPVRDTDTPRKWADCLSISATAEASLHRLVVVEERDRYAPAGKDAGPGNPVLLADDVDRVVRAIRTGVNLRTRAMAVAMPASLWRAMKRRGREESSTLPG